jgi:hypothetical protein
VTRFAVLVGLALRELWFSYRLLVGLGTLILASVPVALLPPAVTTSLAGEPPPAATWYAFGTALGLAVLAALTAGGLAAARRDGRLGWLVLRPVPRASVVAAWSCAAAIILVAGLAASGGLTWLALGAGSLARVGPAGFAAAVGAMAALGTVAIGLGVLAGTVLPPAAATLVAGAIMAAAALLPFGGWLATSPLPTAAPALLAAVETTTRPIAEALSAAGTSLGLSAALLLIAAVSLERADL